MVSIILLVIALTMVSPGLISAEQPLPEEPYSNAVVEFHHSDRIFLSYAPTTGDIWMLNRTQKKLYRIGEDSSVEETTLDIDWPSGVARVELNVEENALLAWDSGAGRVFRLDFQSKGLERIDTSRSHETMHGHAALVAEGEMIYAIGGYGYWEFRNFLIRFDPSDGEWELVGTEGGEDIPRSRDGLLYELNGDFIYIVDKYLDGSYSNRPQVFRLDRGNSRWQRLTSMESVLSGQVIRLTSMDSQHFLHETLRQTDDQNGVSARLTHTTHNSYLNLIDFNGEAYHRVSLSMLGIHQARGVFFSERLNRWIILGHEAARDRRDELHVFLYHFDPGGVGVMTVTADRNLLVPAAAGVIFILIVGGLLLWIRNSRKSDSLPGHARKRVTGSCPVEILKKGDSLIVTINGSRMGMAADPSLERLWSLIADLKSERKEAVLLSDLEQAIFPDQSQQPYKSRRRKKLIALINETCGFSLLTVERSKVDKRYKVLRVNMDSIELKQGE